MKIRLAVLFCLASLCLTRPLLAAEEKKAEHKTEAKKPEAKKEGKAEETKEAKESKEVKHEAPHEAKAEAKQVPAPVHEEKPSPVPRPEIARRAPVRMPRRPAPRPARANPASAAKSAATPAAEPAPIVVQIKQEPARIEAILRVVPYGQASGVPPFAGSGYGSTGPYTVAAYPMEPDPVPAQLQPAQPAPVDPANHYASAMVNAASPSTVSVTAPYPATAGPPPIRNVLRAPKNALTNEGLVTLAQAGYDEDFILDLMHQKTCRFDTSVEGLAYMATHGLTERVVKAALKADAEMQLAQQLEARR